ncbi:MAG: M23 family metallopeptidase [Elainellaceae cyanobacterium]
MAHHSLLSLRALLSRHCTLSRQHLLSRQQLRRAAKLLLLLGLSLPGIAAADIHRELSERNTNAVEPHQRLPLPVSKLAPSDVGSTTNSATDPAAATEKKTLAIDSAVGKAAENAVTDADPERLAALVWSGASFPVENFQAYTSPFGYRSSATGGYSQEFHYGLDIASPVGSYIRSWWSGTIVEISDGSNCGTSVVVESGDWTHIYCHMSGYAQVLNGKTQLVDRQAGLSLVEGQTVTAGDPIGRVGMTGRTTGPHLHWGLKYQGNWVDPAWVVQAMAASQQVLYGQQ